MAVLRPRKQESGSIANKQPNDATTRQKRSPKHKPKHSPRTTKPKLQTSRPKLVPRNLFLSIPPEIRNAIYSFVLVADDDTDIRIRPRKWRKGTAKAKLGSWNRWQEPALLQTCREIRNAATVIPYQNNCLKLAVDLQEIEDACTWLKCIVKRCGPRPFKTFELSVTKMA